MQINQDKINRIGASLNKKYLWWFLKDLETLNENRLNCLEGKKLLYIPNHLSLIDPLVISLVLNQNEILHPSIVSGENINRWPIKKIIPEDAGIIFVDREKSENGSISEKKEELERIKKNIEYVVFKNYSLMAFIEGKRCYGLKVMESPKGRYPKVYLEEILNQNKNPDNYWGINIALDYKPHPIENLFSSYSKFFKGKIFSLYFGFDLLSLSTQPLRKKPTAYINFGEPFPLKEFIKTQDYKKLIEFSSEEVRTLYKEINNHEYKIIKR